jgi:hypothetical protein
VFSKYLSFLDFLIPYFWHNTSNLFYISLLYFVPSLLFTSRPRNKIVVHDIYMFVQSWGSGCCCCCSYRTPRGVAISRWNVSMEGHSGMIQGKTEELCGKPSPVSLCPPQIPHGLTRARTRASAKRGRRLTAWAMALPSGSVCLCLWYKWEVQS